MSAVQKLIGLTSATFTSQPVNHKNQISVTESFPEVTKFMLSFRKQWQEDLAFSS